ncbi:hypothetical protein [Spirilliplanes yamanashiensis]|uniref:DUF1990 domain-containing protein n=1 Tax=Spirilliplanes yamanashiensis TaxID=42233 RepID=A0A8J3YEX7_9ACTN|nr:hypothetical protein [Spirilliplanes yamanashiensis]MDP9818266.1 hypothetical protein [Spirilliplanes yamanashiensis]GIJ06684.1 hypothetical protein Sya03_60360 [Spirilliplanes yamanashiensis]
MTNEPMIIEQVMPVCDIAIAEHRIVDADPESAYDAARELDFAAVHTPLLDAAFFVRTLPARLRGRLEPAPAQIRLTGGPGAGLPGWSLLGQVPGREIAFGAVGVFWRGEIRWRDVDPAAFATFAEPGNGKIACNFSVRPYGAGRSVLSFDCRVTGTDPQSRQAISRYWLVIRPFVGHIMRAALATAAADAARRAASATVRGGEPS